MRLSRTILLFLLVCGLGAWIWLHERHQLSTAERAALQRRAFALDPDRLKAFSIRLPEYEIRLERTGDVWVLTEPKGALAHGPTVRQVLTRLRSLDRGELITPADMRERNLTLADFGLVTPRAVLRMVYATHEREFRVGDYNPLANSLYVREEGSQNVMAVSSDLLDILPRDRNAFRDRRLAPLEAREVTALVFASGDKAVRLERRGATWGFVEPARFNADDARVEHVLNLLLTATAEDFVYPVPASLATGLSSNSASIRLYVRGRDVPHEIEVGIPVEGNPSLCYARIVGQDGVLKVSSGVRGIAYTQADDLRERAVLPLSASAIRGVSIERGSDRLELVREESSWRLLQPVEREASTNRVERMLDIWREAQVDEFLAPNPDAVVESRVSFRTADSSPSFPVDFELLAEDSTQGGGVLLRPHGQTEIWRVNTDLRRFSPVDPLPYLSRRVLAFDPTRVIRVTLRNNSTTNIVLRTEPSEPWSAADPRWVPDPAALERVVEQASHLEASSLVALNPASLEPYGLDKPAMSLSFGLAGVDPANRTLLLQPSEQGAVATVQGRDLVFTLSPEQLAILLADWLVPAPNPPESADDPPREEGP